MNLYEGSNPAMEVKLPGELQQKLRYLEREEESRSIHFFQLARSRFSLYNQRTWFCRGKNHERLIFFLFLRIRKKVTTC